MTSAAQIAPTRTAPNAAAAKKATTGKEDSGFAAALDEPASGDPRPKQEAVEPGADAAAADASQQQEASSESPALRFAKLFALPEAASGENAAAAATLAAAIAEAGDGEKAADDTAETSDKPSSAEKAKDDDQAVVVPGAQIIVATAAIQAKAGKAGEEAASGSGGDKAAALAALFAKTDKAAGAANATPAGKGALGDPAGGKLPAGAVASDKQAQPDADAGPALMKAVTDAESAKSGAAGDSRSHASDGENPVGGVKVVAMHASPAPYAHPAAAPTASALAGSIHAGLEAQAARASVAVPEQASAPATLHTLKIQLQPVSLGTVTAQLHLAGDALRVELRVDNAEARHRLASDSDTIVKSLRALGYDIDHVTIQTVSAPAPTASANGQNATAGGREQSFQQPAGSQSNGQGSSHAGSGRGNGGEHASRHPADRAEPGMSAGSGLFI